MNTDHKLTAAAAAAGLPAFTRDELAGIAAEIPAEFRPADPPAPARKPASDFVIRRSTRGAVAIRATSVDPEHSSGKLLGFTMPEDDGWKVTWRDEHGQSHALHVSTSIAAEALLFDSLNIATEVSL